MIEVHIFGATSRVAGYLGERLTSSHIRQDGIRVGLINDSGKKGRGKSRKVLVILAWSGYPGRQSSDSAIANRLIIEKAIALAREENYDQIVFASSAGALYRENTDELQNEEDCTSCSTEYGRQKKMAEDSLSSYCCIAGITLSLLRITTAYGGTSDVKSQGVILRWIDNVVNGKEIEVWIDRTSEVNFISYEQVADAIIRTIERSEHGVMNIGCSVAIVIGDILQRIEEAAENYGLKVKVNETGGPVRRMRVDCEKSFRVLGKVYESNVLDDIKYMFRKHVSEHRSSN